MFDHPATFDMMAMETERKLKIFSILGRVRLLCLNWQDMETGIFAMWSSWNWEIDHDCCNGQSVEL